MSTTQYKGVYAAALLDELLVQHVVILHPTTGSPHTVTGYNKYWFLIVSTWKFLQIKVLQF